jgi:hypothetical protein
MIEYGRARVLQEFPESHELRHLPGPGDDERLIENWMIGWFDPQRRVGGYHHVGLRWVEGYADVMNWLIHDGRVIAKYQDLWTALPETDLDDFTAGNVRAGTKESFSRYFLQTSFGPRDGRPAVQMSSEFTAFTRPFAHSMDSKATEMASHHYESIGRLNGELRIDRESIEFSGFAFKDHSWGPRNYATVAAHRWICAVFGEDLFMSIFAVSSPVDSREYGWIFDGGEFHDITRVDAGVRMANDGVLPTGCHCRVWARDGRGYVLEGEVSAASLNSHKSNFFFADGLSEFTLAGRRGAGIIETSQLRSLTPAWRRELMLPTEGDRRPT